MTVQTSKNPQVDIAEDNAFFPSEYSLSQYTSPVSDLDGVDYPGNDSNLLIVFYVQRAFTDKQQIKRKAQSFD